MEADRSILREVLPVSSGRGKEGNLKRKQERLHGMSSFIWDLSSFSARPILRYAFVGCPQYGTAWCWECRGEESQVGCWPPWSSAKGTTSRWPQLSTSSFVSPSHYVATSTLCVWLCMRHVSELWGRDFIQSQVSSLPKGPHICPSDNMETHVKLTYDKWCIHGGRDHQVKSYSVVRTGGRWRLRGGHRRTRGEVHVTLAVEIAHLVEGLRACGAPKSRQESTELGTCSWRSVVTERLRGRRARRGLSKGLAFKRRRRWTVVSNSRERLTGSYPKKPGALAALRKTTGCGLFREWEVDVHRTGFVFHHLFLLMIPRWLFVLGCLTDYSPVDRP